MYNSFQVAARYFNYYITSANGKGHGTHSPFVFDFIKTVLNDKTYYPEYEKVEALRRRLITDQTLLNVEDFGAGNTSARTVSSIVKKAAKSAKYAQLLFRIVRKYQPKTILELGTSLGITTSYLSLANNLSQLITLEGSGAVATIAQKNFQQLELGNIKLVQGNFDDTLAGVLNTVEKIDLAFIDGNHRQEPTERYYRQLLGHINNNSMIILDDIHWSSEMEAAWKTIRSHDSVRCSIDLFFIGIVLFRQGFKQKQHFVIRF
jgi:predicted O-methyltransferase YrrM